MYVVKSCIWYWCTYNNIFIDTEWCGMAWFAMQLNSIILYGTIKWYNTIQYVMME